MPASRSYLECTLGVLLSFDIRQVRLNQDGDFVIRPLKWLQRLLTREMRRDFEHRLRNTRLGATQQGFGAIVFCDDETVPCRDRMQRCGKDAGHGSNLTVKGKLAVKLGVKDRLGGQLLARRQYTERDRKIESTARLAHVGGTQVDGDALLRKLEPGTDDRTANAIFAFANSGLRHAHNRERRQPARQENLDRHNRGFGSELRTALQYCETQDRPSLASGVLARPYFFRCSNFSSLCSSASSFSRVLASTASCTSNSSRVTRSSLTSPARNTEPKFFSRSACIERRPSGTDSASFRARSSSELSVMSI